MKEEFPYDERQLLQELARGSEEAFLKLFHGYRNKLYTYIYKISRSAEAAEDAVHDVFLTLWQRRDRLREIENLNAYLYRMAHNRAFDQLQRVAKESLIIAELQKEQGIPVAFDGEEKLLTGEIKEFVYAAIEQLTPQQKKIFLLSRQNGLTHNEIARQMNISINTVKNHLVEALKFLRSEVKGRFGADAIIIFILYQLG